MNQRRSTSAYKLLPAWLYLVLGITAIAITIAAGLWLWSTAQLPSVPMGANLTPAEQADLAVSQAQIRGNAIRNILGLAAGIGAVFALILALRKQYVSEHDSRSEQDFKDRTAAASDYDAAERRLTDLYVKAGDQLGSDNASVRLAGLYSLERLAQDHPLHRQTIVNLFCAYLRMPYLDAKDSYAAVAKAVDPVAKMKVIFNARNEEEVRVTVQRILKKHLDSRESSREAGTYWSDIALNLRGAVLIDFDLSYCRLQELVAHGSTFRGPGLTNFANLHVDGYLGIHGAKFESPVTFNKLYAAERVHLSATTFESAALFESAEFQGFVTFADSKFGDFANFRDARFPGLMILKSAFTGARARAGGDRSPKDFFPPPWRVSGASLEERLGLLVFKEEDLASSDQREPEGHVASA
ncbi:hypothetical protein [Micromonospora sp. NPDC005237]|uniref:pentapeptide repeat-containing protein n=1 Tax=Micromonospora sp. NPDC005237 TaxID=3155113 RepID=UPI0033B238F3